MAYQQPIYNPSLPFKGSIFGGLADGKMVTFQGQILQHIKRFSIDFECGNGDIAFHFNPRFDEGGVVVCNTMQHQVWGTEERTHHMPFQRGMYFEIIINVKNNCYQVSVNGQHFLEYQHRLPLHTVQTLRIGGEVTVNCISFTGPSVHSAYLPPPPYTQTVPSMYPPSYGAPSANVPSMYPPSYGASAANVPSMYPPSYGAPSANGQMISVTSMKLSASTAHLAPLQRRSRRCNQSGPMTVSNPSVPFHGAIVGNFGINHRILIVGSVKSNADRFHVNLKNSRSNNIMLHMNPRFREQAFVRNTFNNSSWGSEERQIAYMPLSPGQAFQMEILNQTHAFKVSVNGSPMFEFRHRIPAKQVDQIEIEGDVALSFVQY